MIVDAFICDNCGALFDEENVLGIEIEQPNLFENVFIYRAGKPLKCTVHFCLVCHRTNVLGLCEKIKRTKDDKEYTYYYNLYTKNFYERVHTKSLLANRTKNRRRS